MRETLKHGLPALLALAFAAGPALGQGAADAKKATVWPAGDIKWTENPSMKGAATAVLWGDPTKGAYGALRKIAGGTVLPLHTHSVDQKVISVAGTIQFSGEGGPAKDLPPGSYAHIPAGWPHAATCKAGADCVYFEEAGAAYQPVAKATFSLSCRCPRGCVAGASVE